MRPKFQHAGYPVDEAIRCPACLLQCRARREFYVGDVAPTLVHICEHCGYAITESEWNPTGVPIRPRVRIRRIYSEPRPRSLVETAAGCALAVFVVIVFLIVVLLGLGVLALGAGG